MHYSLAEMDQIRRWRKHLLWVAVVFALASGVYLFVMIGEAFLAGTAEPSTASSMSGPILPIYLWGAFIANRLAKALDPRIHYYWTVTALMFLPVLNLIVIISLLMEAGRVLAGPQIYR